MTEKRDRRNLRQQFQNKVIAGILTVIPIWVTWLAVQFLFSFMGDTGKPLVPMIAEALDPYIPVLADWLRLPSVQNLIGFVVVLLGLFAIGWTTTHFIGRRVVAAFHTVMERIPMIQTIYTLVRKLISALQAKPDKVQRVVLIDFPSPEMKTVGLVTRTLKDAGSGRDLVAVYVPTTPNPTSGYLEIVPADKVTSTSWTIDEAMAFIISGGAVAPDKIYYDEDAPELSDEA